MKTLKKMTNSEFNQAAREIEKIKANYLKLAKQLQEKCSIGEFKSIVGDVVMVESRLEDLRFSLDYISKNEDYRKAINTEIEPLS